MKSKLALGFVLLCALFVPAVVYGDVGVGAGGGLPGTSQNFTLVGHNALSGVELDGNTTPRGMNAALALYRAGGSTYVYVGNRTDGSDTCGLNDPRRGVVPCPHPHPGILILDATDPSNPSVVGEIGQPYAGQIGISTRELRVWPQKKLLMVTTFRCSSVIHACPPGTDTTFPFRPSAPVAVDAFRVGQSFEAESGHRRHQQCARQLPGPGSCALRNAGAGDGSC